MNLGTASIAGGPEQAVVIGPDGVVAAAELGFNTDLYEIVRAGEAPALLDAAASATNFVPEADVKFGPPFRHPRMIWGIGLNYPLHAADLSEAVPQDPASFIKLDHTIIGPGDPIPIPAQSQRTTAEAEMGIVIGSHCRNVSEEDALDHVLGVVCVLDQTAEDILALNPRFLTRSKNFPGFFSFGPQIVPLADVIERAGSLEDIELSTVVNGTEFRTNTIGRMTHSPAKLIAFHSAVMPLYPGDIISPGTPGAIHINPGDVAECRIPALGTLTNPVIQG